MVIEANFNPLTVTQTYKKINSTMLGQLFLSEFSNRKNEWVSHIMLFSLFTLSTKKRS